MAESRRLRREGPLGLVGQQPAPARRFLQAGRPMERGMARKLPEQEPFHVIPVNRGIRIRAVAFEETMSEEQPDYLSLAVEHVFRLPDTEWSNRLVDLIKRVNPEAFKARLLEAHKQKRNDPYNNQPGVQLKPKEKWLPNVDDESGTDS